MTGQDMGAPVETADARCGSATTEPPRDRVVALLQAQLKAKRMTAGRHAHSANRIGPAIHRLRGTDSPSALYRAACSEVSQALDFTVTTLSTVEDAGWTMRYIHTAGHTVADSSTVRWADAPAERECVDSRSFLCVGAPVRTAALPTPLRTAESYVVAPIVLGTRVVALLHGTRTCPDSADRYDGQMLDVFAAGIAAVSRRIRKTERVRDQRDILVGRARRLVELAESIGVDDLSIDVVGERDRSGIGPVPSRPAVESLLTPRESEVLRLIAAGASNAQIGDRLVITTETVKSHVKKILRKLGAVNRAEAISLYLSCS